MADSENETTARRDVAPDLRNAFYAIGLVTLVFAVLTLAAQQLAPIVLAILVWFLVNAIANGLRHFFGAEVVPMWAGLTLGAIVVLGAMFLVGQLVVSNMRELGSGLTGLEDKLATAIGSFDGFLGIDWTERFTILVQELRIEQILANAVTFVSSAASDLSIILLYVFFLLLDQPYYERKMRALFPSEERRDRVSRVLNKIGTDTRTYVWLMTMVSVAVGLLTYAIASFFGLKGAAFWGFLAFALNYIPTVGSFLGVIFPALFAIVQFDSPEQMFLFIALLAGVQFVMGNILLPRLAGDRLNLSQFVVILSLTIWGTMWGVYGLFLAVPMMMVLAIVLSQFDATRSVAILMSRNGRVMRGYRPHSATKAEASSA